MSLARPAWRTLALYGALPIFAFGCGRGLFDSAATNPDAGEAPADATGQPGDETGAPPDADALPAPDALPSPDTDATGPDAVDKQVSKTIDSNGGTLQLDGATLTLGPGTFQTPTLVTLREIGSVEQTAIGVHADNDQISLQISGLGKTFLCNPHHTRPYLIVNRKNINEHFLILVKGRIWSYSF